MTGYIIAYHGEPKKPANPEEGVEQMGKWKAWLGSMGDAVINPGSPLGQSKVVTPDGILEDDWPNAMFGFTIIEADSMEHAVELAGACPVVEYGGSLRVAELMQMPG